MTWIVELAPAVKRAFKKELDRQVILRTISKLEEAASLENPTAMAKPMTHSLRGLWSYRIVGEYQVILAVEAGAQDKVCKYFYR